MTFIERLTIPKTTPDSKLRDTAFSIDGASVVAREANHLNTDSTRIHLFKCLVTVLVFVVAFSSTLVGPEILGVNSNSAFAQAPVPSEKNEKQKSVSLMKQHPWATFTPGVWKTVRIVSESFDKEGKPLETSLTDTKSTLESLTDKGVELSVEVSLWLAGRRLDPKPQSVEQGYHGEVGTFEKQTIERT